jgi:hypothetical protein
VVTFTINFFFVSENLLKEEEKGVLFVNISKPHAYCRRDGIWVVLIDYLNHKTSFIKVPVYNGQESPPAMTKVHIVYHSPGSASFREVSKE